MEQLFREIVPLNELPVAFVHDQVHIRCLVREHRHPQDWHPVVRGLQGAEQATVTDEQSGLVMTWEKINTVRKQIRKNTRVKRRVEIKQWLEI